MSPAPEAPQTGPLLCACPGCARQWDARGLAPGTRLSCTCGQAFELRPAAVHAPRVFRCGQCGAALPAEGQACNYCAAEITLEERGLSGVCPGCSARLAAGARFCAECGIAIQPQRLSALREGVACPRCRGTLRVREIGPASAIECASCAGLWIARGQFEELCARAETQELARAALPGEAPGGAVAASAPREGYIPCLSCGSLMLRKNYGEASGVVLDLCKDHGVWLDHRELERILQFVRGGGLLRAREREQRRVERTREQRAAERAAPPPAPLFEFDTRPDGGSFGRPPRSANYELLDLLVDLAGAFLGGRRRNFR